MFYTNLLLQKHSVRYELCFKKYFQNGAFLVWKEHFLHTSIWVSEEGQEFENLSKKRCFLNFEW